ncbi:MAG: D-TA family PLP-dependent enzyme [Robiginitalea sp.]|nr:D-TA family PLP-dependent enzyme [Robiginitalea sp.]
MENDNWFSVTNAEQIDSPALLIYPERIRHNIEQMVHMAGDPQRLRPHIKTHKMAEIIAMQQEAGIEKFKCATLAEAELLARCGAKDVLVAYPLTGPGPGRLANLQKNYPETRFSCLVDHPDTLAALEARVLETDIRLGVFLDLNVGMNRTGISPGQEAEDLYARMNSSPVLDCRGLHVYDGHLRNPDPLKRGRDCDAAFKMAGALAERLQHSGLEVPFVVAGGSPTFPFHAKREGVELSPGTTLLWDARYGQQFPEMPFLPAAALLCRVISKPAPETLCLDLGHKAVAAEMDFPRVHLPQLPGSTQVGQSEEHLVLRYAAADRISIGTECYAIPMHICPTVIKYPEALVVTGGQVTGRWQVAARDYHLAD